MINESILEIKRLVQDLHCMGTYGMVELELNKIEKHINELEGKVKNLTIQNVSNSFNAKYAGMPTVKIQRGNKTLIQQRYDKNELLKHVADKYPDWEIVLSNCG